MDGPRVVKVCRRCGSRLAADNDNEWCSPCLELRRFYDPRTDPHFLYALLAVLQERPNERVEPVKALGLPPENGRVVRDGVRALRRQGWVIHAAGERCTGYRFVGYVEVQHAREAGSAR